MEAAHQAEEDRRLVEDLKGCPLCADGCTFLNPRGRHLHNKQKHRNKIEFECQTCYKAFNNGPEKEGHICRLF